MLSVLALLGCGLASCVKEDFPDPDDVRFDPDGYSLGITIKLDDGKPESRTVTYDAVDSDPIDNYIDTRNRLRVLFFDENGQFIFEAVDRTVMERSATDGSEWFVHIPVNYVVDAQDKVYDVEALKKQLMEHDFKVAILANWEYRDANGNVTTRANAEPQWGYYNSILCTDTSKRQIKNINDLHHLVEDSIYASGKNEAPSNPSSTRPDPYYVYGFLMNGNKMGIKSDWVAPINKDITSQAVADTYIRTNWDPASSGDDQFSFGYYRHMWSVWNFSAAYRASDTRFTGSIPKNKRQAFVDKCHYNGSPLYKFMTDSNTTSFVDDTDDAGLSFDLNTYPGASIIYDNPNGGDAEKWGIRLPNIGSQNDKNSAKGIKFTASASGTLRIRCASSNNDHGARLAIFSSANGSSNNINYFIGTTPQDITRTITVNEDAVDYYIYCNAVVVDNNEKTISTSRTDASADIFEIEYIKDKYLNDTNRERVLPSEDQPIPMYGVQNFSKLENWKPGSTFDLSHDNRGEDGEGENGKHDDYEVKHISLIRALAKVVVYLPAVNGNPPTHVYLRSMNRTARCEPMDVETPTDRLWTSSHKEPSGNQTVYSDGICEWFLIQNHGPFFQLPGEAITNEWGQEIGRSGYKNDDPSTEKTTEYQNRLAWFHGSWGQTKWTYSNNDSKWVGWNFGSLNPKTYAGDTGENYPHLFNPSINRSDFARIPRDESYTGSGFYRYVIYVPDKNIDDPNYVGVGTSVTKIAHIEYRYNENVLNVDDNNCYRVYFTDYTKNTKITTVPKTGFDNDYELISANLAMHWPIMRNHAYVFAVGGVFTRSSEEGGAPMVQSQVTTYSGVPISVD